VVLLNRAVATRYVVGPEAALAEITPLAAELDGYRLFHALRAGLLTGLGRDDEAREASERALAAWPLRASTNWARTSAIDCSTASFACA
jgi:RNA polymerase sigma-70 factor (ECF subfamily)